MRVPRVVLLSWAVATALTAVVVAAAWHYLSATTVTGHAMHGMSTADALTRGGGSGPTRRLFTSAFFDSWQLDAPALVLVVLLGAAYLTGVALVPVRGDGGRWPWQRTASFFAGLAVIVFATCGSIAVYDQVLFTAHMAGHLSLVMLAPVLLMAGRPLTLVVEAGRPRTRDRVAKVLQSPVPALLTSAPVALGTYAAVIVVSHLTGLMDDIMRLTWAGQVEHLVYLVVGCQFFVLVVGDEPLRWRLSSPARWLLLAVAMAVDTFTGLVLLQGSRAIDLAPSAFPVNALSDTRTGGAIMWVGGDAIMAFVMIALVVAWLNASESGERPATDNGWLEQARRSHFAETTGSTAGELDDDDNARDAYNEWLARLDRR